MSRIKIVAAGLLVALTAALTVTPNAALADRGGRAVPIPESRGPGPIHPDGAGDATVVAVIDTAINPYHWDFLASKMPQHLDGDPRNDLPLDVAPDKWMPGFPNTKKFTTYEPLKLKLEESNKEAPLAPLDAADAAVWNEVKPSTAKELNYYWLPDTKVIGAMTWDSTGKIHGPPDEHGVGTTSSSVGNLHGTCPECLLFFIQLGDVGQSEAAIEWAMDQPWIDAVSNSYGFSIAVRDRIYSGSNVKAQRAASERGQTVFFSAGNGNDGSFVAPNTTSFSSQEGPDWIVTVGAVSPGAGNYYGEPTATNNGSYTGAGKPADIAGIGLDYPTAYTSTTVGGTGASGFGGTSNATPEIAGIYARALYLARRDLRGPSKIQRGGVIAVGADYRCGHARRDCELKDGKLTATELRTRLFHGAVHTAAGMTTYAGGDAPPIGEEEFLNEGHGSYRGRETGNVEDWLEEFERLIGVLEGREKALERPEGEREWMIVDSFCRQHVWGPWKGGYYIEGKTELPGDDPNYPMRSGMQRACPTWQPPP